ncbi:pentatricopeptide repeat-containing protein [Citrus sinensis]|uniref:Pentacotripeptide-repeat region of PRORP domain-containing protein n=1 Tax=Citrus unshiu TaxID=55188 RepID=A0A2H5PDT0_CITUN|nr:pentatricopeptide repeat-containing protein [Citrus sinensis]GAY50532.1 hypothetical protein CUMW_127380 [Citrus unshiu]
MAAPLPLHHQTRTPALSSDNSPLINLDNINNNNINSQYQAHFCLVSLEKCSTMRELKQIHAQMLRTSLFFDPCAAIFSQISNPTIYTCNSIVRGYTNKNLHHEAFLFYHEMIVQGLIPDRFMFPSLFKSCADIYVEKQLHSQAIKFGLASDSFLHNTLINMYSSCWCLDQPDEAIKIFYRMEIENVKPNAVTLVNVLTARARARDLRTVKRVHKCVDESGFWSHVELKTTLMDAYCKCKFVSRAWDLFVKVVGIFYLHMYL